MQKSSHLYQTKEPLLSLYHIKFSYCKTAKHPQPETRNVYNGKSSDSTSSAEIPSRVSPMVLFPCPFHSRGDCIRFTRISLFNSGHITHPVTVIIMQLYLSFYSILHNVRQSVNAFLRICLPEIPKTVFVQIPGSVSARLT